MIHLLRQTNKLWWTDKLMDEGEEILLCQSAYAGDNEQTSSEINWLASINIAYLLETAK